MSVFSKRLEKCSLKFRNEKDSKSSTWSSGRYHRQESRQKFVMGFQWKMFQFKAVTDDDTLLVWRRKEKKVEEYFTTSYDLQYQNGSFSLDHHLLHQHIHVLSFLKIRLLVWTRMWWFRSRNWLKSHHQRHMESQQLDPWQNVLMSVVNATLRVAPRRMLPSEVISFAVMDWRKKNDVLIGYTLVVLASQMDEPRTSKTWIGTAMHTIQ